MSGIHLNFIVEGQTEETFVNQQLKPHLEKRSISAKVRCVQTSRKRNITYCGGLARYPKVRDDISRWMDDERGSNVYFTTMFDLFGLPKDFPGYRDAMAMTNPQQRATALEDAMCQDIGDDRLLPYIQVHEFEALVLADPQELLIQYCEDEVGVRRLEEMAKADEFAASPELINSKEAPSKRIKQEIPTYKKRVAGPIVTARIGLPKLRNKCPHFHAWINRLESPGSPM